MIRARKNSTAVVISPTVTVATRGRKKVLPDSLGTVTTATRGRKKVLPDSLATVTAASRGRKKVEPAVTTATRGRKKVEPVVTVATRGRKKVEPVVNAASRGRKKVETAVTLANGGKMPQGQSTLVKTVKSEIAEAAAAEIKATTDTISAAALAAAQRLAEEEAAALAAAEIAAEAEQELLEGVLADKLNYKEIKAGETNYKKIKAQIKSLKGTGTNFVLSINKDYIVSSSTKYDETTLSQEELTPSQEGLTPSQETYEYREEIKDIKNIGELRRNKIKAREKEIEAREKGEQIDEDIAGLEQILEDDEFNSLLNDLTKIHDLTKIQGGKKGRGRVIKAKYGKKYRGGNVTKKLNWLKDKVKEGIFGATIQISQEDSDLIDVAAEYFKENMEGIAEDDVHERNLDTPMKTKLLLLFGKLLKSERGIDRVVKSFRAKKIVEIASANETLLTTYKKKVTGRSNTLKSIEYVDGDIFNKLYRPHQRFYIYGMQLPHQFDRIRLLGTIYKLNSENIYSIVDLHDCNIGGNGVHPLLEYGVGCNPYDRDCELDMWSLAISTADKATLPNNAKYYGIEYQDMTSGNLSTWNAISCISNIRDINNQIVIHCLAGAGRTGSVMLYLLMRDFRMLYNDENEYINYLKGAIAKRYFGCANIRDFIDKILYPYFTIEDDANLNYNRHYIKCMMSELFEIEGKLSSGKTRVSLFRQRLNYIIFFLARHFNIATFVIYHNPETTKEGYQSKITGEHIVNEQPSATVDLDVEFVKSYEKTIDWKEKKYDIDNLLRNIDSDDYKEVMSWIL